MKNRSLWVVGSFSAVLMMVVSVGWAARWLAGMERRKQLTRSSKECRVGLRGIFIAERSYFGELDRYSDDFRRLGFEPERGNSVVFLLAAGGSIEDRSTPHLTAGPANIIGVDEYKFPTLSTAALLAKVPPGVAVGVTGTCPRCEFTALCVTELQRWSVASIRRTFPDGGVAPAGLPFLEHEAVPR